MKHIDIRATGSQPDFTSAKWIAAPQFVLDKAAPHFRCEFELSVKVVCELTEARWHLCGLGYHEPWCNGARVGDHVLDPAQSDYDQRCFYVSHDVTALLREGANALGVVLGNGWFNQNRVWSVAGLERRQGLSYGEPRLIALLELGFGDGTQRRAVTDETWRCTAGPIVANNIYAGERYDARLEIPGWCEAGFEDQGWVPAMVADSPGGALVLQDMPPIRCIERLKPINIRRLEAGTHIVDMGQNFAGWAEIRVQASCGTAIQLRFAETLDSEGNLDTGSTGVFATDVEQIDQYTCKGTGLEVWQPRFTYHGFRFVEVSGWPGTITASDITGIAVHNDLPISGSFQSSDDRLNQLHNMALWTHRSNIHSIPEDCPARERCGWLGDANIVAEMSLWNYDAARFWKKYLDDIETTRRRFGGLPAAVAPGKRSCGAPANPDWAAAFIMLPWYVYLLTADIDVLAKHYDGTRQLIEHFGERANNWILEGGYGDWFDPGDDAIVSSTLPTLTTTLWFLRCAKVMSRVATLVGCSQDAERYESWVASIKQAFVQRFYDAKLATFGSQTANAMALAFDVVPLSGQQLVAKAIADDIALRDTHLNTGIMGVRYIFEVLSRFGYGEVALKLMHQDTYPSFGDWIGRGATTLWEWWGEEKLNVTHGPRSMNHPMFAGFDNWFFNTLAGIQLDPQRPGFEHLWIKPLPIKGLNWIRVHHQTRLGGLEVAWTQQADRVDWQLEIPDDCEVTFTAPGQAQAITLSGGCYESKSLKADSHDGTEQIARLRGRAG